MGEQAHTAGEWRVHATDETLVCKGRTSIAAAFSVEGNWEEAEANARLIASAPDLLEATEPDTIGRAARSIEKDYPGIATTLLLLADRQRAAIQRATGGE